MSESFDRWIAMLETRHLADLTFPEVSRALRALSSTYVERRGRIAEGAALSGSGKRAAFALFYAPLHYLLVREIATSLRGATERPAAAARRPTLVDLGCGTGAASAAWAGVATPGEIVAIVAIDRHRWALDEAAKTFRAFNLPARTRLGNIGDLATVTLPNGPTRFLAAFAVNELPEDGRNALLERLLARASAGDQVLIVEPLAASAVPWWRKWAATFVASGGRADQWRFRVGLPPIVAKLDRAAGLRHDELTGRSLSMNV